MNDQQRAAMIRPRGKSEAPHMIAAYRAMQMAWEYIDWMLSGNLSDPVHEALTVEAALREALENNELSDVTLINEGDMAQHLMDYDQGFVDGVEEGLALAQPQDNLNCKSVQARLATLWGYVKAQPQESDIEHYRAIKKRNAEVVALETAQPQGEWVDLTDDDWNAIDVEIIAPIDSRDIETIGKAAIAKFKEKNTPPVVPQGEPVVNALRHAAKIIELYDDATMTGDYMLDSTDCAGILNALAEYHARFYTAPLFVMPQPDSFLGEQLQAYVESAIEATKENESKVYHRLVESAVAHAIEATKEKAAKVCEEIVIENCGKTARNKTSFECAAAIRSMK